MANLDQAVVHFEDALAFCRKAGYRPVLAWTCCDYADALRDRDGEGDRSRAGSLLDESSAFSSDLGMRPGHAALDGAGAVPAGDTGGIARGRTAVVHCSHNAILAAATGVKCTGAGGRVRAASQDSPRLGLQRGTAVSGKQSDLRRLRVHAPLGHRRRRWPPRSRRVQAVPRGTRIREFPIGHKLEPSDSHTPRMTLRSPHSLLKNPRRPTQKHTPRSIAIFTFIAKQC